MIDYDTFCLIKRHREEGLQAGQIALELGLDSRTVRKWMGQERFQLRLPIPLSFPDRDRFSDSALAHNGWRCSRSSGCYSSTSSPRGI